MFQEKVNKIIEEIKENPELKQHLEQVLAKRYSRKIRDINKEKQEQEKEKEKEEKKIIRLSTKDDEALSFILNCFKKHQENKINTAKKLIKEKNN